MGTFIGHLFPGVGFAGIALWWIVQMLRRYHCSKQKGTEFESSPTFKCDCLCGRLKNYEIEGLVKVIICSVGVIGETITGFSGGKFVHYGNGQHISMFAAFGLSGVVDVLQYHGFPMPEDSSYAMLVLGFVIEGVLFNYHLHGRDEIDVHIHTLLVCTIFVTVVVVLAETRYRKSVIVAICRAFLVLLQGMWFIAIGFLLYNPFWKSDWDPTNHKHFMLATMLFTMHILGVALICVLLNCIIARKYNESFRIHSTETHYYKFVNYRPESAKLLEMNANDGHAINLNHEEDFD